MNNRTNGTKGYIQHLRSAHPGYIVLCTRERDERPGIARFSLDEARELIADLIHLVNDLPIPSPRWHDDWM